MATEIGKLQKAKNLLWPIISKKEMHQEEIDKDSRSFLSRFWFSQSHARTWSRWRSLYQMGRSCRKRFHSLTWRNQNIFDANKIVDLSRWVWRHWTIEKSCWLQPSVVYIKPFTPRIWRTSTQAHALLEVSGTATVIEFFFHLVAMEWILVVFPRIQRTSMKEDVCKGIWKNHNTRCVRSLG